MAIHSDKTCPADPFLEPQVHIVGPLTLQNKLMAWYLQQTTGLTCVCCKDLDVDSFSENLNGQVSLILLDCLGSKLSSLWSKIRSFFNCINNGYYIAIFNMAVGQPFGNDLVKKGVRGIFYNEDSLSNITKGVPAILKGEFWFSRNALIKFFLDPDQRSESAMEIRARLTTREEEILLLIRTGISNSQIAEKLFISRNTVKTHLYNIYRKLNVPNRLQAALWAAKHL